jgi:hypothetical protein
MKIETTINVNRIIMIRLDDVSRKLNKSRMYIIRLLLAKMLEDNRISHHHWSRIRYQKRDLPENWHTFHLTLREDEYEYSLDLRKVYKMSLSHAIAYAVNKYLDRLYSQFAKNMENSDNYLYKNYLISHKIIDGIHCWKYYWGYPERDIVRIREGSV